ncbi:hypothetical protein K8R30_04685 [archaeon]|nr:hypothetical protein [archaeon]
MREGLFILLVVFGLMFVVAGELESSDVNINLDSMELVERGMDYDIYFDEASGKKVAQVSPTAINYFDGEGYSPINRNIVRGNCEYDYCVREGIYYADFRERLEGEVVKFLYNGSYIKYLPLPLSYINDESEEVVGEIVNVLGKASENEFVYVGAYGEGLDLGYEYNNILLKENLIIESLSSLPVPSFYDAFLKLSFEVDDGSKKTDGKNEKNEIRLSGKKIEEAGFVSKMFGGEDKEVSVEKEKWERDGKFKIKGRAEFIKGDGSFAFELPRAFAIDSAGEAVELEYEFEEKDGKTIVSVLTPYDWLAVEGRVYPVRVDPSTGTQYSSSEGYFMKDGSNNFYDMGTSFTWIEGGYTSNGGYTSRSYERWALSSSVRDELESASSIDEFILTWYDDQEFGTDDTVYFYSVDEDDVSDWTPDNEGEIEAIFDAIGDSSFGYVSNPSEDYSMATYFSSSASINLIENAIDNNEDFIIGFGGIESGTSESRVRIGGRLSNNKPRVSFSYTCDQASGCQACLSLSEGVSCDCDGECDSGNCLDGTCSAAGTECYSDGDCEKYGDYVCEDYICVSPENCEGTVTVFGYDSENEYLEDGNAKIYLNDVFAGNINEGYVEVVLNNENTKCGASQKFEMKCSDGTSCDIQYTSMDTNPDYDSLTFVCDVCKSGSDLFISESDIGFEDAADGETRINVDVHAVNIWASNVNVQFRKVCGGVASIIGTETIPSIGGTGVYEASVTDDLSGCSFVTVFVDSSDVVNENPDNNQENSIVINPVSVYLYSDTGLSKVDSVVENYLDNYVDLVSSSGEAQMILHIGKNTLNEDIRVEYFPDKVIKYSGKIEGLPYNGIIIKDDNDVPNVYVFGNDIDGTIAALRELVVRRNLFLNENTLGNFYPPVYLGEEDIDAISVFDYFHTDENQGAYKTDILSFANAVDSALRKKTFNLAIKRVMTNNDVAGDRVALRLKHINSEMSPEFREYNEIERPVVLARGLWSNLFTWEDFGVEIARGKMGVGSKEIDGVIHLNVPIREYIRDTWLIEITGGPNTECENCPNYDFEDLVDYYWPALIGGVQAYTGKDEIDYVGFSNGCRTALASLEEYQEDGKEDVGEYVNPKTGAWKEMDLKGGDVVHTFVGVGCPGAFEGESLFGDCILKHGKDIREYFEEQEITHISGDMLAERMAYEGGILSPYCWVLGSFGLSGENMISQNLSLDYFDWIENETDVQPGNFAVEKFLLIYGTEGWQFNNDNDYIVTEEDSLAIYNSINATTKSVKEFDLRHPDLPKDKRIKEMIREKLNEK